MKTPPMKKITKQKVVYSKKKPHFKPSLPFGTITIVLVGVLLVLLCGIFVFVQHTTQKLQRPVPETEKNEMKAIPPEVKKEIIKESPTASISATIRVPILLYHYVEYVKDKNDIIRQKLNINPNIFEQQIITLKNAGYTFMTAKELGEVLDGQMRLPLNPILLTFDDGHWDFDTVILPILRKYNVKATSYVIPGFIGGSDFMTPEELKDVINSNLVDVGAHTVHHISLKGKPLAQVQYEINESKLMLEKQYHIRVVSFAYPYGTFDLQTINTVKAAGFITAVSTIPGVEQNQQNRFFLYRIRPGYRTGQILLNFLQQRTYSPF